jgi:zinc D-Ala-D-Ala dipeptidase
MRVAVLATALLLLALQAGLAAGRPPDIVDASTIVPDLKLDMRYAGAHNFVGQPIAGYRAPKCLLTREAAEALKAVQEELLKRGLSLKVYDCYRPQRAVDDFVRWGRDLSDQKMKPEFYPNVDKRRLFSSGYIASKSGHSRASTVDLTIVPINAPSLAASDGPDPLGSCEGKKEERAPDSSLDMGTGFDCFSERSHTNATGLTPEQGANRQLLKSVMARHGFRNLSTEWWHYTLRNEPYPGTYFNFPVE